MPETAALRSREWCGRRHNPKLARDTVFVPQAAIGETDLAADGLVTLRNAHLVRDGSDVISIIHGEIRITGGEGPYLASAAVEGGEGFTGDVSNRHIAWIGGARCRFVHCPTILRAQAKQVCQRLVG